MPEAIENKKRWRGNRSAPPSDPVNDGADVRVFTPLMLLVLALPLSLLIAVGFGYPMIKAVLGSVTAESGSSPAYLEVARDAVFWRVLVRTLLTALLVTTVTFILAYPTAEFVVRSSTRIRPILLGVVVVPLWSSVIARTYGWVGVFIRDGLIDQVASIFGSGPLQLLYSPVSVLVGMIHVLLPIMILPIYTALVRSDDRLTYASLSLGAGTLRTILRVRLPSILPAVVGAMTAVFVLTLGFYVTPALLGGPDSMLISNLVGQQVFQRFDLERAGAMSIALLVAALATLAFSAGLIRLVRRRMS